MTSQSTDHNDKVAADASLERYTEALNRMIDSSRVSQPASVHRAYKPRPADRAPVARAPAATADSPRNAIGSPTV